uniref:SAM domain-containing protein n=1 Tax=Arion vulgaris TaxID=1028688 RepID=A0A0B7B8G1_9EUPU
MVDDNRQLASHIDQTIQTANQEVSMLRTELSSTNSRLKQMNIQDTMGKVDKGTQVERLFGAISKRAQETCNKDVDELRATIQTLTRGNKQLVEDYRHLLEDHDRLKISHEDLKRTNESLKHEIIRLEEQLHKMATGSDGLAQAEAVTVNFKSSYGEIKLELIQARQELIRAKEVLQDLKSDRKRLKGEKLELLSQMKQLYTTLEEKETELRDFILTYEQRVKESDEMFKQFAKEKEHVERDKWEIINKAKDAAERALFFKSQLDTKEQSIKELEAELKETKEQLDSSNSAPLSSSTAAASDGNVNNDDDADDDEVFPSVDGSGFSTMEESSVLNCVFTQEQENDVGHCGIQIISCSPTSTTDSIEAGGTMFKWFTQSSDLELPLESKPSKKKKKSFGSLSRVFSRNRMRRSVALSHAESYISDESSQKLCLLSQDNYQEKLATIEKMVNMPMQEWRAPQVLAWLEITLAMPMYAHNCLTNVKSGKVVLDLSDNELSAALGVINPMHRRKLRLAIEQHRNLHEIKYIKAGEMDSTWIAHRFLPDLGLPQYTDVFEEQLCDGHVLNTLTRRDLEKHFSVHRKFYQSSILHAVELLRRIEFNKEKLYQRRNLCESKDTDLIVWTNERLMKWIRSIDLGEYSENLTEGGLHGAVMVLEPSFNADTLASILGIPPSKSYLRRHLTTELDNILKPARTCLDSVDGSVSSTTRSCTSSVSHEKVEQSGFEDNRGRRKSEEEGRALLAEILGRKYEAHNN